MREIKFRGKDLKGERWWYGSLAYFPDSQSAHIIPCGSCKNGEVICDFVEVQKDTIGQFTGLRDMNGTEIYEGDLILAPNIWVYVVCFYNGCFGIKTYQNNKDPFSAVAGWNSVCKVIGNIHDNPEYSTKE